MMLVEMNNEQKDVKKQKWFDEIMKNELKKKISLQKRKRKIICKEKEDDL